MTLGIEADIAASSTPNQACQAVADHLYDIGYDLSSVYLARRGRLRCHGIRGYWQIYDGIPATVGVIGQCFRAGEPISVRDVDGNPAYVAMVAGVQEEICVPVHAGGRVVGVVSVEGRPTLPERTLGDLLRAAALLGDRLSTVGVPDDDPPARRLTHHAILIAQTSIRQQAEERIVAAARDLTGMGSALLAVRESRDGSDIWRVAVAAGALAPVLAHLDHGALAELDRWIKPGMSLSTMGSPDGDGGVGGTNDLRAHGVNSFVAVPLDSGNVRTGLLLVVDERLTRASTDVVEQLELLSALGGANLRTHRALEEVRELAAHDALTGLGHHGTFQSDLGRAVRPPMVDGPCVALIDVDHFKDVNDLHGHPAGDDLLRRAATVLTSLLRGGDRAYRIGGDEFAVLLRTSSPEVAATVVTRLHTALSQALAPVTVSVGYAQHEESEDAAMLVARADAALYEVKRSGRAGIQSAPLLTATKNRTAPRND